MLNKEGLAKMLRDLRVLDFLKQRIEFSIDTYEDKLYIEKYFNDGNFDTIEIDVPSYIKNDLYEWVVDDEI